MKSGACNLFCLIGQDEIEVGTRNLVYPTEFCRFQFNKKGFSNFAPPTPLQLQFKKIFSHIAIVKPYSSMLYCLMAFIIYEPHQSHLTQWGRIPGDKRYEFEFPSIGLNKWGKRYKFDGYCLKGSKLLVG